MPLAGHIDLGHIFGDGTATWTWYLKGQDNNHYIAVGSSAVVVAQAESLSVVWSQSSADWQADLNTESPVGYSGTANNYNSDGMVWPVVGTSKFYVTGLKSDGTQTVLIRYNIDNTGTVVLDAAFIFTSTGSGWAYPSWVFGANAFGSYAYFVTWGAKGTFNNGAYQLVRLPLSGTFSSSTWADYTTEFQSYGYFDSATSRRYSSRAAILPDKSGKVGILSYLGFNEIANTVPDTTLTTAGSEYWVVDPAAHTVIHPISSVQSKFGQPWADSGTLHAGGASTDARNDYVAPTVNAVAGGYEIIFGRPFSDSPDAYRFRRYFMDSTTYAVAYVDTFEGTVSGSSSQPMPFASRDSGNLLFGVTNQQDWYFGQAAIAAPTTTVSRYYVERLTQVFDDNVPDAQHFTVDSGIVPPSARLATSGSDGFNGIRCYGMDLLTVSGATTLAGVLGGMDIGSSFNAVLGAVDFAFSGNFTLAYVQSFGTKTFPEVSLDQYQVAIDSGTVDGSGNRLYHVIPFMVGFPYTSQAQLLRPNHGEDAGTKDGPAMGKIRRNHKYAALLYRTQGDLKFGTDFATTLHPAPLSQPNGTAIAQPTLFSGTIRDTIADDYSTDGMIAFQQTRPGPGTIISIAGHIETQDE